MRNESEQLKYLFAPLDSIDAKSLAKAAAQLKKSKDKAERAIGVFLHRFITLENEGKGKASGNSKLANLRDLK